MNNEITLVVSVLAVVVAIGLVVWLVRRLPRRLNQAYFQKRWLELLGQVKSSEGMAQAVIDADKLLDEALKKRKYRGKTMGGRLVSAQRIFTDNDAIWYAHKLRNKLTHQEIAKLKQSEAKQALAGLRQALKDLGAI